MAEVEKLSPDPGKLDEVKQVLDVRKAVEHQLRGLRQAGLSHLAKGTGQYSFELDSSIDEPTTSPAGIDATPVQSEKRAAAPVKTAPGAVAQSPAPSQKPVPTKPTETSKLADAYGISLGLAARQSELSVIQEQVAACTKCAELASHRTQTVFGVGNPAARLVFVGEGPGAEEDRQGEPFVGEAGQLLDKIISACKLSRNDVFILNTVKCRPPANRNPSQDELANCWGFAERQLEIIQPEFICCLGSVASKTLLKTTQSLGRLRRRFHQYRGSRVLVTYHPAYLLRTPSAKRHVWEDMQLLMKEMGVDLSN